MATAPISLTMNNMNYILPVFVFAVLIILYIMRRRVRLGKRTPKF